VRIAVDLFLHDTCKTGTANVNHRHINNNKTSNIKDKNLKIYYDVLGRLYIYHTTKTAKMKISPVGD